MVDLVVRDEVKRFLLIAEGAATELTHRADHYRIGGTGNHYFSCSGVVAGAAGTGETEVPMAVGCSPTHVVKTRTTAGSLAVTTRIWPSSAAIHWPLARAEAGCSEGTAGLGQL